MSDVLRNPQDVFAQTRQGSEEILRTHTSPTFVCARARSKPTSSKLEPCLHLRAESTSWTFGPIRGSLRAFQHLMSPKPTGFASFRRCQLAGEGCGTGCGMGLVPGMCCGVGSAACMVGRCGWVVVG